jgi:hypothetical protein
MEHEITRSETTGWDGAIASGASSSNPAGVQISPFAPISRLIDSLHLTAKHQVATPVNWKQGGDVILSGSVSDEDHKKTYPDGWKSPKPHIRIVPRPKSDHLTSFQLPMLLDHLSRPNIRPYGD